METKFHVEAIRNWQEWDAFIERSPQGTVFSSSDFLRAQGKKHLCFNVLKGDQRKAGLCLFVSEDETEVELGDYAAYNGICFEPMPCEQKPVRYFSEQCQITRFLVEAVISKYQRVRISLAPQHPDLRPFLWYNYASTDDSQKYTARARFTSYLDISDLREETPEFESHTFRRLAEQPQLNIKKARKVGLSAQTTDEVDRFLRSHEKMMSLHGVPLAAYKSRMVHDIVYVLLNKGSGKLFAVPNKAGQPTYFVFFVVDSKRAYYLYGAGDQELRGSFCGTIAFWDACRRLAEGGVNEIDFLGVNSPRRGAFKLSFGGRLIPYFEVQRLS